MKKILNKNKVKRVNFHYGFAKKINFVKKMLGFNKKLPLTYLIKIEKFKKLQTNNIVKKKSGFKI